MAVKKTIELKRYTEIEIERAAAGTITPGMIVQLGSGNTVTAHSTAGGNVLPRMFALGDFNQGRTIDEDYVSGEKVRLGIFRAGDVVNAILADGQSVSIGDDLESAGNGYVQAHTADIESPGVLSVYPEQIVGIALEAVDTSDSSGGESSGTLAYAKRIAVMIV